MFDVFVIKYRHFGINILLLKWSERRDSNPRPRPWQGRALPTELLSQYVLLDNKIVLLLVFLAKVGKYPISLGQGRALPTELLSQSLFSKALQR